MLQRIYESTVTTGTVASVTYTAAIDMNYISTLSVQAVVDVNTPSAITFPQDSVVPSTDTITSTAYGFALGLKVRLTSTGTLPAGLATATDYFVIPVTANTYKLASSLVNALAGTPVNITDTGTAAATGTATPTAIAGGTLSFQRTNVTVDNAASTTVADWADIDTATTITADSTTWYSVVGPTWRWFRIKNDMTAGSMSNTYYVLARGENNS